MSAAAQYDPTKPRNEPWSEIVFHKFESDGASRSLGFEIDEACISTIEIDPDALQRINARGKVRIAFARNSETGQVAAAFTLPVSDPQVKPWGELVEVAPGEWQMPWGGVE